MGARTTRRHTVSGSWPSKKFGRIYGLGNRIAGLCLAQTLASAEINNIAADPMHTRQFR